MVAAQQILQHGAAQQLLGVLFEVAAKLLHPALSDSAALYVGGFVGQLILQFSRAMSSDTVQEILSAGLSRLGTAQLPSLKQNLVSRSLAAVHAVAAVI